MKDYYYDDFEQRTKLFKSLPKEKLSDNLIYVLSDERLLYMFRQFNLDICEYIEGSVGGYEYEIMYELYDVFEIFEKYILPLYKTNEDLINRMNKLMSTQTSPTMYIKKETVENKDEWNFASNGLKLSKRISYPKRYHKPTQRKRSGNTAMFVLVWYI